MEVKADSTDIYGELVSDVVMAEAKVLYKGMEKYVTGLRVDKILKDMAKLEVSYSSLTDKEKAELFDF